MPFTALDEMNRYRACRNAMNCTGTIVVRTATVRNADLRIVAAAPRGDREWTTEREGGFRTHCRSGIRLARIKGRSIMRRDAGADIDQRNRRFPPFLLANKCTCA
jgi:hypothetical protein